MSVFQCGPTLPLCRRDSSPCGRAHRPSFRSSVSLPVWPSLGTPRTAMAELSLNLCDGRFYFGFLAFVADQSSPKKTFIVSCHFRKVSPSNVDFKFVVLTECASILSPAGSCPAKSNLARHPTIHSCHRACNTRVAPFEIAVRFHNIRVDPVVLVGVFLLLIAGWLLLWRRAALPVVFTAPAPWADTNR